MCKVRKKKSKRDFHFWEKCSFSIFHQGTFEEVIKGSRSTWLAKPQVIQGICECM